MPLCVYYVILLIVLCTDVHHYNLVIHVHTISLYLHHSLEVIHKYNFQKYCRRKLIMQEEVTNFVNVAHIYVL